MMIKISLILYFICLKLFYSTRLPVKLFSKQIIKMISLLTFKAPHFLQQFMETLPSASYLSRPPCLTRIKNSRVRKLCWNATLTLSMFLSPNKMMGIEWPLASKVRSTPSSQQCPATVSSKMANRPFAHYTIRIRIRMANMTETEDTMGTKYNAEMQA